MHNGHLQTVAALKHDFSFDHIRWVLSAKPPHRTTPGATAEQRLAMLDLALQEYVGMESDDIELRREGPSYTVLTLQTYRQAHPDCNLTLIVGADVLPNLPSWYQSERIFELANVIVMHRAGYEATVPLDLQSKVTVDQNDVRRSLAGKLMVYAAPEIPISATAIRNYCQQKRPIKGLVPEAVEQYIKQYALYSRN